MSGAIDAVVIGRNEGERLVACLASLGGEIRRAVYVDSGSTDGSVAAARAAGVEVIELDPRLPFSAARARNAGLVALNRPPAPELVQMLDGDCVLDPGWIGAARAGLGPGTAIRFGRRRERFPQVSVYNRLCDWEWDVPLGPARACGGDFLARYAALEAVGGYREDVIAAEDDELCQRLLGAGWGIERIDAEMTLHDAAMTRFRQWWRRAARAGHGFAQVGALHPGHFVQARRRVWFWALALPLALIAALVWAPLLALPIPGLYAVSWWRSRRRFVARGFSPRDASRAAWLLVLSKFPNLQGMLTYYARRLAGRGPRIIEYK